MDEPRCASNLTSESGADASVIEDSANIDEVTSFLSPIRQDLPLTIFKMVCLIIGVPLNVIVSFAVLRFRRLRSKPRNIFLLGITFSNLLAFIPAVFEIVYHFQPTDFICRCFVSVVGLPDIYLLLNIFLSLMDRYVAIRDPLWHRVKVTVPRVAVVLVTCFILAVLTAKSAFIFQFVPVCCRMELAAIRIGGAFLAVLFTLCLIARVTVYYQTKKLLLIQHNDRYSDEESIEMNDMSNRQEMRIDLGMRMNQHTLRRMELEATRTLVAGVTSLFVLTCPLLMLFVCANACRLFHSDLYCHNRVVWMANYFKQLALIHAIYHPVIYLAWNEEFSSIFKRP